MCEDKELEEGQNFRRKLRKWMKMDMKQIRSYVVTGQAWGVNAGKKKYPTVTQGIDLQEVGSTTLIFPLARICAEDVQGESI